MQRSHPHRRLAPLHTLTKKKYTASTADKYELYQLAVQRPADDLAFLVKVFKKLTGKTARHFREDFCGTALLASEWVKQGPAYTAEAFDLDPAPLAWGWARNVLPLGEDADLDEVVHLDRRLVADAVGARR